MSESSVVLLTLVIYKVLLISIGLWASRRVKTEDDFFLGGRGVGAFVSGLSYAASTSSAWVLLGFSGFVYVAGVSALWMVPGIWAGYIVMWLWIARPLREETRQLGHITLTDYLTTGLAPATARPIAILSTLLIVFCFVFYIAAQFDAAAKAFVDQFGLGRIEAVVLGAVIILVYCLLGGFWAVSVTDTLQGIVMMAVAIGLPIFAVMSLGGPGEMFRQLAAQAPSDYMHWSGEKGSFVFLGFAMGLASIGLGAFGQPHLLNRLMALKDDKARRQGFAIAMSWAIAVYIGMAMLALAGRAMTGGALADGEVMFYRVASDVLPPVLAGIVIAAILSAVMSTVDSILLAASAAVAHDLGITKRYKAKAVFVSRLVMVAITILAVVLTLTLSESIFNRVLFAWSALGAAFGPVVFARVSGREPSGQLIFWAILSGFAMTVLFYIGGTLPLEGTTGPMQWLVKLSHLQGDPFERLVPWVIPMVLMFGLSHKPSQMKIIAD